VLQTVIDRYRLSQKIRTTNTAQEVEHFLHSRITFLSYPVLFFMAAEELGYTDHFLDETVSLISATQSPYQSGMFVKQDSPYKEIFNYRLLSRPC